MRKTIYLLFAVMFMSITAVFADDVTLTETFKGVTISSAVSSGTTIAGNYFDYTANQVRRNASIPETTDFALWFGARAFLRSSQAIEGGIKDIAFNYARFGSETGNTLRLMISIDGEKIDSIKYADNTMPTTATFYTKNIGIRKNFILQFDNLSYETSSGILTEITKSQTSTNAGRIYVGNYTWTPYLFYTTKAAEVQAGQTFTNAGLINNVEIDMDAPVYSSNNQDYATVNDVTGEVTGVAEGVVIITATTGNISTSYTLTVLPSKPIPTASFAKGQLYKCVSDEPFINNFSTNSDGIAEYTSSNTDCATVDGSTGQVTILASGQTIITANIPETDNFADVSKSYTLDVKPDGWHLETFDGAQTNVGNSATYNTSPISKSPSSATGITWTVLLGSIRDDVGYLDSNAALIRGKYPTSESTHGYLLSNIIEGGISSIAFDWNSNGSESGRTWDISVFVNTVEVGKITSVGGAVIPVGGPYNRFTADGLNITGAFTLKIVNNSTASADATNHYRFALDNLEWVSYDTQTSNPAITGRSTTNVRLIRDVINIQANGEIHAVNIYNIGGVLVSQMQNSSLIPVNHLPTGLYLVEILLSDGTREISKIIKTN